MTAYSEDVLNSVAGHVQQVVLAAILQQEANRDYVPDALATDFTKNSVTWQLVTDTTDAGTVFDQSAYLQLSITFPLLNDSPLVDRASFFQRVGTINNTSVAALSLPREANYESVGTTAPDPLNPNGFPGGDYPAGVNDTFERRLCWLLETLLAKFLYIKRWNTWSSAMSAYAQVFYYPEWIGYSQPPAIDAGVTPGLNVWGFNGASRRLMRMGELPLVKLNSLPLILGNDDGDYEQALQGLINDADSLQCRYIRSLDSDIGFEGGGADGGGGDITSAAGEEGFFDPASESSTNLQNFLSQPAPPSLNNAADGATGNESQNTSLKDC